MKNVFIELGTDTLCKVNVLIQSSYFRLQFLPSLSQIGSSCKETMLVWFKQTLIVRK